MNDTRSPGPLAIAGAIAWLGVPLTWGSSVLLDQTREWEGAPQRLFGAGAILLLIAGLITLLVVSSRRGEAQHRLMATGGLVVLGLGLVASLVAWFVPLWTTIYGIGMLVLAWAGVARRLTTFMSLAFLGSTAGFVLLTALEVGTPDEYGDYPIAGFVAVVLATIGPAIALLVRQPNRERVVV